MHNLSIHDNEYDIESQNYKHMSYLLNQKEYKSHFSNIEGAK